MWKIMWKIISVVFFSGLLIFACIAIYFNDKKIISRETLFDNVPFTKKLFSDKKFHNNRSNLQMFIILSREYSNVIASLFYMPDAGRKT